VSELRAERTQRADRFFFYSHDAMGLGHVRRNLSVAGALADLAPEASILIGTSIDEAERFGVPARADLLRLPGLRKTGNERYEARKLHLRWTEIRDLRAEILAAAVTSFRPSVVLVDKHPLGVGGELRMALDAARLRGARMVLGIRDVLDDFTVDQEWRGRGFFAQIAELYDHVLIYGQPDVFDPLREYDFPADVAALCSFCGYVVPPASPEPEPARHQVRPAPPRVLATAGGGEDGFELLRTFVEAASGSDWQAVVVSGAQCPPAEARRLERLADDAGLAYRRFVPELSRQFGSLDALVCMGGYNTLAEAAASGVATVCVPRVRPRREQLIRARMFERRGLVRVVEPRRLDPDVLRREVDAVIENNDPDASPQEALDLDGARRAALRLLELAAEGGPAPEAEDCSSAGRAVPRSAPRGERS
jgi:predicted glycosyltransferase